MESYILENDSSKIVFCVKIIYFVVLQYVVQGWGNHTGKSGHDLTNILTLDTGLAKLASYMFYYDNKNNTGLTNKMLLPPSSVVYIRRTSLHG